MKKEDGELRRLEFVETVKTGETVQNVEITETVESVLVGGTVRSGKVYEERRW